MRLLKARNLAGVVAVLGFALFFAGAVTLVWIPEIAVAAIMWAGALVIITGFLLKWRGR